MAVCSAGPGYSSKGRNFARSFLQIVPKTFRRALIAVILSCSATNLTIDRRTHQPVVVSNQLVRDPLLQSERLEPIQLSNLAILLKAPHCAARFMISICQR